MGVGPLFISRVIAFLVVVLFLSARTPADQDMMAFSYNRQP